MAHSLAWRYLSPEQTHKCLSSPDVPSIRATLQSIDEATNGSFISSKKKYNEGQVMILLDMLAHLILFTKSCQMSPEKVSTLIGIVLKLHEESMLNRLTRAQSYHKLRDLILQHSTPRPPFACAIFNIRDVQEIDAYMLQSYFRHYKMYHYAFIPREVANIRCLDISHHYQIPPVGLPSLITAIPENEWKTKVEEAQREAEANLMKTEEEISTAVEQERLRQCLLEDPHYSDGIREQLAMIKQEVSGKALDRLDEIEARLEEIEKKVMETTQRADSRQGKRKK